MSWLFDLIKIVAILAAAGILGNWFLREVKQAKRSGKPWYTPYTSLPGILVIIVVLLPLLVWIVQR